MKKNLCLILLACSLMLTVCGCDGGAGAESSPSPSPAESASEALPQREQDWLEDIEFLRKICKTKHMDPFYICSEEEFDRKLDQLSAKVGSCLMMIFPLRSSLSLRGWATPTHMSQLDSFMTGVSQSA